MTDKEKRALGKYYTVNNPFNLRPFRDWFNKIPNVQDLIILEPFAGSNNIPRLMNVGNDWACFDIVPTENVYPKYNIEQRDTIANFPTGYSIAITNPPYQGKSSASRNKIDYLGDPYDDLYKKCLDVSLGCVDYLAAIIPESFITAGEFRARLDTIISLPCKMFDDTECPVCLALFDKDPTEDFLIYTMEEFIGQFRKDLLWYKPMNFKIFDWKFNDPSGEIGIITVDNTEPGGSLEFILGKDLGKDIKDSSRFFTRVSLMQTKEIYSKESGKTESVSSVLSIKDLPMFIRRCNEYLAWFRYHTKDVFLTSSKGLRKDGLYRRRLDFDTAKGIMERVLLEFKNELL